MKIKRYRSKFDYSYTLGMAPTVELIYHRPEQIQCVYIHPEYRAEGTLDIYQLCRERNIPFEKNAAVIGRVADRDNVYVLGVFFKYEDTLAPDRPHVLLVNPSNTGNLGTIVRTGLGFGYQDVGIITPGVDHFHPSTLRASMGAVFSSRMGLFDQVEAYREAFPHHTFYSFMLEGKYSLKQVPLPEEDTYSLVFGNESTGLPRKYLSYGESLYIRHSPAIDSLNLSIAFGIGAHHFAKEE